MLKRIVFAFLLGIGVLFLSSVLTATLSMMTIGSRVGYWLVPFANQTAMAVFATAFILLMPGADLRRYGFNCVQKLDLSAPLLWSVGVGSLAALVGMMLPVPEVVLPFGSDLLLVVLLVWFYASICEEILTRGLIQGYLEPFKERGFTVRGVRLSTPVLVSAVFFGLMHIALLSMGAHPLRVVFIVVFAFALGLIAGFYRERSGSLIPAIIVHSVFNVTGWAIPVVLS